MGYWGNRLTDTNNLLRFLALIVLGVGSLIIVTFWRSELFSTIDVTAATSQLPVIRTSVHDSALKARTDLLKQQLNSNQ